ncbi:MAG: hypothetical protein H6Q15_1076 [Bacteroidetes bacterium]|nr:hypothetical protein [Bacteroidota bacterium]
MEIINDKLKLIRNKIIDYSIIGLLAFSIFIFGASVIGVILYDINMLTILYGIELLVVCLTLVFNKYLSPILKTHIVCCCFIFLSFLSAYLFGLSGRILYGIIGVIIGTLMYGRRLGIIYTIIAISGNFTIGLLYSLGYIDLHLDFNKNNLNILSWVNASGSYIFVAITIILAIGGFYKLYVQLIFDLGNKYEESQCLNEELMSNKVKLEESEEKILLLLDSTVEGIYGVDLDGNCTYANKSCLNFLGYKSEDELIGKNMHNLIHYKPNNIESDIHDCIETKVFEKQLGLIANDEVFQRKDGSFFPVEYYYYPQIKDDKVIGSVITFIDITEKKSKENIILEINQELNSLNNDKDKFIRILAHDLKNPFNSLIGFSQLLLENIDEFEKDTIKEQISIINETSINTYELLEDILLWLMSQAGKIKNEPSPILFSDICSEIINNANIQACEKNIKIDFSLEPNPTIFADRNMFKTIMRNLLSNAIKFTKMGGKISISASIVGNDAIICVKDNGIGMSKEKMKNIWVALQEDKSIGTSGERGTGLGLSICKEFVEKNNGKIWVKSTLGEGSDFKFTLPLDGK